MQFHILCFSNHICIHCICTVLSEKQYFCNQCAAVLFLYLCLKQSETHITVNSRWLSAMMKSPRRAACRSHTAVRVASLTPPHSSFQLTLPQRQLPVVVWGSRVPLCFTAFKNTHTKLDNDSYILWPQANDTVGDVLYEAYSCNV